MFTRRCFIQILRVDANLFSMFDEAMGWPRKAFPSSSLSLAQLLSNATSRYCLLSVHTPQLICNSYDQELSSSSPKSFIFLDPRIKRPAHTHTHTHFPGQEKGTPQNRHRATHTHSESVFFANMRIFGIVSFLGSSARREPCCARAGSAYDE